MTFLEDLEKHYLQISSGGYNPKFSSLREALSSAYEELEAKYLNSFVESGGEEEDWEPLHLDFDTSEIAQKLCGFWQLDDSAVQLELGVVW
jgi:hypothetical protein